MTKIHPALRLGLIVALIAVSRTEAAAAAPVSALREYRAVWVWASTINAMGPDVVAADLQQTGITDAILLVKDEPTFTPPEDLKAMTAWRKPGQSS